MHQLVVFLLIVLLGQTAAQESGGTVLLPALAPSSSVGHMRTLVETMLVDVSTRIQQGTDQNADAVVEVQALMAELSNTAAAIEARASPHDLGDKRLRSSLQQLVKEKEQWQETMGNATAALQAITAAGNSELGSIRSRITEAKEDEVVLRQLLDWMDTQFPDKVAATKNETFLRLMQVASTRSNINLAVIVNSTDSVNTTEVRDIVVELQLLAHDTIVHLEETYTTQVHALAGSQQQLEEKIQSAQKSLHGVNAQSKILSLELSQLNEAIDHDKIVLAQQKQALSIARDELAKIQATWNAKYNALTHLAAKLHTVAKMFQTLQASL